MQSRQIWLHMPVFAEINADTSIDETGDYCARIWPERGRIMAAQFSVACGLPLSVLLLKGLPVSGGGNAADGLAPLYGTVMLIFGLLISWCVHRMPPLKGLVRLHHLYSHCSMVQAAQ